MITAGFAPSTTTAIGRALLQGFVPAYFVPLNRSIGGIVAQVTIEESERDELTITEHPVEQGAPIADHAFKRPSEVTLRVGWSATQHNLDYINGAYGQLLSWQAALNPFQLYTGKRVYNDMLISSISVVTDQSTERALIATVICRQIIRVRTSVVETSGVSGNAGTPQAGHENTAPPAETGNSSPEPQPEGGSTANAVEANGAYIEAGAPEAPPADTNVGTA